MRDGDRKGMIIMKKYKKLLAVLIVIAIIVTFVPKNPVHADALTAGMLGSIAYSIATATGINFAFTGGTAASATSWMQGQMEEYAGNQGLSVVDFFGTDAVLQGTTILAVGKYTYDKIAGFLNDIVDKYKLGDSETQLQSGDLDNPGSSSTQQGYSWANGAYAYMELIEDSYSFTQDNKKYLTRWLVYKGYGETENRSFQGNAETMSVERTWQTIPSSEPGRITFHFKISGKTGEVNVTIPRLVTSNQITGQLKPGYEAPQPLPQGKQWEGDFAGTPGFAEPPTDLRDFLSRIPAAVADNQLIVTEEITEAGGGDNPPPSPSPSPSPRPDPEPVPNITIAQKIAAILGEIMGLIGLTGDTPLTEEQQQQIADTAQNIEDSVKDVTQNITDTITQQRTETSYDIQEQTQTLTDGQTQIKDAIQDQTQTLTDTQTEIKDAIQDQTKEIEETKDAIKDATQVPTDFEPQKHPLPRGVFPFCIPFDLHDIIVALDAAPVTPEVHIPFRVPTIMGINFGLDYTFDLDLHDFDGLAQVLRTLEFIAFGVGLLFVTGKVIKW